MEIIDVGLKAQELSETYENVVLSQTNDHVVRISRMTEPYFWHLHPDSDETFLGIEGVLILELEHQRIELKPGQMVTVPKGTKHRTSPAGSYSVNLTFEQAGIETCAPIRLPSKDIRLRAPLRQHQETSRPK
jgi:mannose-6-phosphate isomerase-like protein (cupin superfamily)